MKIKRITLCFLLAGLPGFAAAGGRPDYRDFATVVAVEPIVEASYQPSTRRICRDSQPGDEDLAPTIGEDIRRQIRLLRDGPECRSIRELQRREQVSGYWVTYRYGEHTGTRRMSYHPGERLAVDIRINPLR